MSQTIEELKDRVQETGEIFNSILGNLTVFNNLGQEKKQQLITGINKAYGQAKGFLHEYMTTMAAEQKGRVVITQTHADVSVGAADALFSKAIECKSVTKPDKGSVNKIIGDAVEQLGGGAHNPRADDVRVVDVQIDGNCNPWPLAGGSYGVDRFGAALETIKNAALAELKAIILGSKGTSVMSWLNGENLAGAVDHARLRDVITSGPMGSVTLHPNSSRPIYQDNFGVIRKIRCLTIKIRYSTLYLLTPTPPNQLQGLKEIIVQCYMKPVVGLWLETAKTKVFVFDTLTGNTSEERIWA